VPSYIDVSPAVLNYDGRKTEVKINLSNLTTYTVVIPSRAIL
jgi:hypothetical protein